MAKLAKELLFKKSGRHFKIVSKARRKGPRGIVFRSLAEKKFAEKLESLTFPHWKMPVQEQSRYEWEYEPKVMLDVVEYHPDFLLIGPKEERVYHEIKAFRATRGKLNRWLYRPVDRRWPTIKKLWRAHGPATLKVWYYETRKKDFTLVQTIVPVA